MDARFSGYVYALLTAALWSLTGPLSRLCFSAGLEPLEVAFWRALLGGICFACCAGWHHELRVPIRHGLAFALFGLVGVSLFFGSFLLAVQEGGVALSVILMYTAPLWVALFSRLFFQEAISRRKGLALGIAMTGTLLVSLVGGTPDAPNPTLGVIFGLASGFFYATHYPFMVWGQRTYSTATLYAYTMLAGAAALFPFVHFAPSRPLLVWLVLLVLGGLTTYGAYLFYGQALRRISPVRVSIISNLEPVLGTFFAWLFWNEVFPPLGWAGGALVLAAVTLLTTEKSTSGEEASLHRPE